MAIFITKRQLIWCPGNFPMRWQDDFIVYMENRAKCSPLGWNRSESVNRACT
jgi:hypothetical protein